MARKPRRDEVERILKNLLESEIPEIQTVARQLADRIKKLEEHSIKLQDYVAKIESLTEDEAEEVIESRISEIVDELAIASVDRSGPEDSLILAFSLRKPGQSRFKTIITGIGIHSYSIETGRPERMPRRIDEPPSITVMMFSEETRTLFKFLRLPATPFRKSGRPSLLTGCFVLLADSTQDFLDTPALSGPEVEITLTEFIYKMSLR